MEGTNSKDTESNGIVFPVIQAREDSLNENNDFEQTMDHVIPSELGQLLVKDDADGCDEDFGNGREVN